MPTEVAAIRREHVEAFLVEELRRVNATSVHIRYRALQQFFKWTVDDGELVASPMANVKPPFVPAPVPIIREDDLAALMTTCSGTDFASRRDLAIVGCSSAD
jgi:site-specific recombinase XerC